MVADDEYRNVRDAHYQARGQTARCQVGGFVRTSLVNRGVEGSLLCYRNDYGVCYEVACQYLDAEWGGSRILTQVSPVAHASKDDDALPEVTGHIAKLADYEPREEAESLVEERDQE